MVVYAVPTDNLISTFSVDKHHYHACMCIHCSPHALHPIIQSFYQATETFKENDPPHFTHIH